LAAADPSHKERQRDLSLAYSKIGNVLKAQSKFEEALNAYRDSLTIAEHLVAANRNDAQFQEDLNNHYENVGDVLKAQGKFEEALKTYRDAFVIAERLVATDRSNIWWQRDLQFSVRKIGGLAYDLILARDFTRSLEASDLVISIAPDKKWMHMNRAHALMFLGRVDEARALHLQYRGEKNVEGDKSWKTVVLEDFAELRKAGLTHPLMDEIEKRFEAGG
jgi:tetratricopeptide (TPR) repeat protein